MGSSKPRILGEEGNEWRRLKRLMKMGGRVDSEWTSLGSLNQSLPPMKIIASIFELNT